ncbi:filamentous hemagglutinin N-terminal domain-containing protein [Niveispirillum irakense]|uniref:filamentous hemagglutinin N-terminal domain-containing protein n=1 Tax=Niveispirillum irakense TaxID=34011 RepID=UPI0004003169|nr:filamentous hemagglutinin N-terminal domain-containing protein [Niveispirillum irakense]
MTNRRDIQTPFANNLPGFQRQRHNLRENLLASASAIIGTGGRKGPRGNRRQRRAGLVAAMGGFVYAISSLFAQAAWANPTGGTVVAGQASIIAATPQTLNIVQGSDKAIINWQGFSIAAGETVNFLQPNAQSVTLNRVVGNDPSAIFGSITANGTVMLVNPNGVFFGKGSRVDVGGLVATTANIADKDFLAGNYAFNQASPNLNAGIVNEGLISIKDSGLAALVAPSVQNSGLIQAKLGKVALGGARSFTLDFQGDGLLSFDAGSLVASLPEGADGKAQALVVNSGQISAEGGTVVLSARAVKGVIDNVINTDGVISATSISGSNGKIVLSGGDGKVQVAGTVDASGTQAGQTGGTVIVDAANIDVAAGTRIDASGDQGGGVIAVGSAGSRDGAWAAGRVHVADGATMAADALTQGNGGTITVLSEKRTDFAGSISAKGGAQGGDGGFAEVSSRDVITLTGDVDMSAAKGKTGTFLLDPSTLKIVAGAGGSLNNNAVGGNLPASTADAGANTVSVAVLSLLNSTANIVLEATGLITVDTSVALQTGMGNSFTLRSTGANGGITFSDAAYEISTQGGNITLDASLAGSSLTNIGKLTSNGGNVTLLAGEGITLAGDINTGGGTIRLETATGNIANVTGATPLLTAPTLIVSALGGHIGATGAALSANTAALTIRAGGNFYISNQNNLNSLTISTIHGVENSTNQYSLTADGLTFAATDGASATTLTTVESASDLAFDYTSDRGLAVGIVDAKGGNVSLTANGGDITGTGNNQLITGNALTLVAKGTTGINGAIGASGTALNTNVNSLNSTSGSGIVNIGNNKALVLTNVASGATVLSTIQAAGDITVGSMSIQALSGSTGNFKLSSTGGSILDDGNAATLIRTSGGLVLEAANAIGTSVNPISSVGSRSFVTSTNNGGTYITNAGVADNSDTTFTQVYGRNGDIVLNVTRGTALVSDVSILEGSGNITISSVIGMGVGKISTPSGNVSLTLGSGRLNTAGEGVTANKLTAVSNGDATIMTLITKVNTLEAVANGGSITVTQTGSVTLDRLIANTIAVTVSGTGAETTVNNLTSSTAGAINLTTSGKITGASGNKVTTGVLTINAGGDVGSSTSHLKTETSTLSITNTGGFFIDNSRHLTSLTINNKHSGTTPNGFLLNSMSQTFDITDNGTTVTISDLSSSFLTSFSFTSDVNLVLGRMDIANVTSANVTTTNGFIQDDGNANTFLTAKAIKLTGTEGIEAKNGVSLGINTADLTVTTTGNLMIANQSHFNTLVITSTHKDSTADYQFSITGRHLDLKLTDSGAGYNFERLIDSGYGIGLGGLNTFSFTGDRDITLGQVNTGSFVYTYTPSGGGSATSTGNSLLFNSTKGAIKDDGDDSTRVLASFIAFKAAGGVGGSATGQDMDITARGVSVTAGTGSNLTSGSAGIYLSVDRAVNPSDTTNTFLLGEGDRYGTGVATSTGDVVVKLGAGDLNVKYTSGTQDGKVSIEATAGSLTTDSSVYINATDVLTLKASQNIGSSTAGFNFRAPSVVVQASSGLINIATNSSNSTTITSARAGDTITLSGSNSLVLGAIDANKGASAVTVTSGTTILNDEDDTNRIYGSEITFKAGGAIGSSSKSLDVDTVTLSVENNSSVYLSNSSNIRSLNIVRTSNASGTVSIAATGQTIGISSSSGNHTVNTLTSDSDMDVSLSATGSAGTISIGKGDIQGGNLKIVSTGAITSTGTGSMTAWTVNLTAGDLYSIGTDATNVKVNSGRLTLQSGRNIYVSSDVALTHLAITSTNSTTASNTASLFGIKGASGSAISITDDGTTVGPIDVSGATNSIVDFSFTGKKNITINEIVASGAVRLVTEGGGANSNITLGGSGGGSIAGSSVTLIAKGSVTGAGSIGTSTQAMRTTTASLTIENNGDIYIDNSNTALTKLAITSTHKTSATTTANTYSFTNVGSGRSVTISTSSGVQTVGMASGSGTMDFSYSVDRAILTGTIDAGTSSTGKVSLTSTGGATGVSGTINRASGSITAGELILSAKASNGGVGNSATLSTTTQKLTVATSGDMSVSNSATLTDLTLDVDFRKNTTSYTHSLSSTGLTFTADEVVPTTSVTAFKLTNISQSGLNLSVTSTKSIQVENVSVGTGTVKLTAAASGSKQSVVGTKTSSVITAGRLEIDASGVGNSVTGQSTFYGTVGQLKINANSTVNYQNAGNLAVDEISNRSTSPVTTNSTTLKVTSGALTQLNGGKGISTNDLTLTVEGGDIGTSGNSLQIETESLTLTTGASAYIANQADLSKFTWTAKNAATRTYSISGQNLDLSILTNGSTTQITKLVDTTGLDFDLTTDNFLELGLINVQKGRTLSLSTTGTVTNISRVASGTNMLTAGKITLKATGAILRNGNNQSIETDTEALFIETLNDVYINNSAADLQTLSIKNTRTSSDGAATYGLTSKNATISITGSSSYAVSLSDTTGLDFIFDTKISQIAGIIDLTKSGALTLKTEASIFGGANSSLSRITAASVNIQAINLGSSGNRLYLDAPLVTLQGQGDVYVTSSTHIDTLSLTNSSTGNTGNRTFDIVSAGLDGTAGAVQIKATHTDAGGTTFSQILDKSGMDFTFTNDRLIIVDKVEIGASNSLKLVAGDGIRELDGTSYIKAGTVQLSSSSGMVGQTAGTGGGLLDITTGYLQVVANNGAHVDLKQNTWVDTFIVGGTSTIQANGDLNLSGEGPSLNGAAATITVTNGSILGGGKITGAGALTLTASGSIGTAGNALTTTANNSGTTTLTATASGGGIYLQETNALTINGLTAAGDVVVSNGNGSGQKDMTIAGAITATGNKVTLTATNATIKSNTASSIDAAELVLTATGGNSAGAGGIGAGTNANTRVKTTATKLTINTGGDIYVGAGDLTDLTINRATAVSNTASTGTLSVTGTNLTFTASDNGNTTTLTNISDTTGLNLTISAKGSIAVGTISVGSGSVNLNTAAVTSTTTATSITAINGSSLITAGSLSLASNTLAAAAIGSSSQALKTNVGSLTLTTGAGGAYISNAGTLSTGVLTSGAALSVTTTAGDLTLNGATTWGNTAALTLDAAGKLASNGITLVSGGNTGSITLKAGTGIGSVDNIFRVTASNDTNLTTGTAISATVTGNGSLYLGITGAMAGGLTTAVQNGSTNVTVGGALTITSMTVTQDAFGNDIRVTASGDINIGKTGTAGTVSAGINNGAVVLTTTGAIRQGNSASSITGGTVTLSGTSYGASLAVLGVHSRNLTAITTASGIGAYFKATGNELGLSNVTTNGGDIVINGDNTTLVLGKLISGGGNISVDTGGTSNLRVGEINAAGLSGRGNVTLTSSIGSILDDGLTSTVVTGNTVVFSAFNGIGSSSNAIATNANVLMGNNSGNGSIYINDSNSAGVSLGDVNTALSANNGSLNVKAAGPVAVVNVFQKTDGAGNDVVISTTTGDITITKLYAGTDSGTGSPSQSLANVSAAGSILVSGTDTHIVAGKLSLTAGNGNIGAVTNLATGAGTPVLVKVSTISGLSASKDGSVVSVSNSGTGASTLGNGALTLGNGSSAYIKTAGDLSIAGLSLTSGNLLLESGGTLTLPSSGSFSTTGAITLKGTTDIVTSGGGRTLTITASELTFISGSAGGNTTLTTTTGKLNASLTGTGKNLTVSNTGALTGLTLAATGNITFTNSVGFTADSVVATGASRIVTLTATTGDMTLNTVNAGGTGTLNLSASAGKILSATGGSTLTGETLNMTTASGLGTATEAFQTNFTKVGVTVTGTGGIYLSGTSFILGDLVTNDGDIVVTATGNITDGNATKSFSAGSGRDLTLTSTGGNVTLGKSYSSTGTSGNFTVEGKNISVQSVSTAGAQSFKGATTLAGNLTGKSVSIDGTLSLSGNINIKAISGDIGVTGTLTGNGNALTLNAGTSTVTLGGVASGLSSLNVTGSKIAVASVSTTGSQGYTGAATLNGKYTSSGNGNFIVTDAVTLAGDTTISVGTGDISLSSTVDGAHSLSLNSSGSTSVGGAIGGTTALASVTTDAGGSSSFRSITTNGAQTFNDTVSLNGSYKTNSGAFTTEKAVTLAGDTTIDANKGAVGFKDTVNGGFALVVNSSGATSFAAAVGGVTALASLTTDAGGTVTVGNVTTTGAQSYGEAATIGGTYTSGNGNVSFGGATTLTGATTINAGKGDISFAGTVDGAQALTLNNSGKTSFSGAVGGTTALASLTTGTGATSLRSVTTTGAQSYGGAVTLNGTLSTTNSGITFGNLIVLDGDSTISTGKADISVAGTINGAYALTLNSSGTTKLAGAVGGTTALTSLTTDAGGSTSIVGVKTTGTQTYNDAVVLTADTIIDSGKGNVTFASTITGPMALTVNSAGVTSFGGEISVASITTDAAGTLSIAGGKVTTTGAQSYGDAATLTADTTLTGTSVTLAQGAQGAYSLSVKGDLTIGSATGAGSLTSLSVSGTSALNGNVTTTGAQNYQGASTVTGTVVLTSGGRVDFGSTVSGTGDLTVNSGDVTRFGGAVQLGSLVTDAAGTVSLAGSVSTKGVQTYGEHVTLEGKALTLTGTTITLGAGADGAASLTILGNAAITGNVGATTALTGLDINGTTSFSGGNIRTTGTQTYGGALTLLNSASVEGTSVTLTSGANGAGLTVTGNVVVGANSTSSLTSLAVSGTTALNGGTITTSGAQTYSGAVTLNGAQTLSISGVQLMLLRAANNQISFGSTLDGASDLTINAGAADVIFGGAVGGTTGLGALVVNSSGLTNLAAAGMNAASITTDADGSLNLNGGSITTSGAQTYGERIDLTADSILTGSLVTLGQGASGAWALTINGNADLSGIISLSSLSVSGSTALRSQTVTTTGTQNFGGSLTLLGSEAVLTGSLVSVAGATDGNASLDVQGNAVFGGAVGSTTALKSVNVSGTTALNGGGVTSSGAQTFGGTVTLGANTVLNGGSVAFKAGIAGPMALTVNSAGVTSFGGEISVASVTTDAAGTLSIGSGKVTTTGTQSYGEAVTLTADTTLTGTSITLAQGAQGAYGLSVKGDLSIGSATGASSLTSLSVSGTSALNGNVTTTGAQNYQGASTVTGTVVLTSGGRVDFGSTVSGTGDLTVNSSDVTRFGGAVQLASLVTDAAGSLTLGGNVTTSGAQTFGERAILAADVALTGSAVTLSQGADGAFKLAITGGTLINGAVGANTALTSLDINGKSTLNAGITTSGTQTYGGAVTLGNSIGLAGGAVRFTGAVDGARTLSITGPVSFGAAVGANTALAGLHAIGASTLNGGTVTTTGNQTYAGAVTLGAATLLSGGAVDLQGTVTGPVALTVNSAGLTRLGGSVNVASLTTDAAGSLNLTGGAITTSGAQTYGERAMVGADTVLTGTLVTLSGGAEGAQTLTITGNAALGGTVAAKSFTVSGNAGLNGDVVTTNGQSYGSVSLNKALALTAGGDVLVNGAVSGAHALTVNSAGLTRFGGAVTVASLVTDAVGKVTLAGSVTTTGVQTYGDHVTLEGKALTLTGSTVTLGGGADGASNLTIQGVAAISGAVGATTALISLDAKARSVLTANVTTSGTQTYGGAVSLIKDVALAGGGISFNNAVDGAHTLSITGPVTFNGTVGNGTALTGLTVVGASTVNGGTIVTTGAQTYAGAVTLGRTTLLSGGSVDLQGAVTGPVALTVNSAGQTRFGGNVNVTSITTDAAGSLKLDGGTITASEFQNYRDRVILGADTVLTSRLVVLNGGAEGAHVLTIAGGARLNGTVAVKDFTVSRATELNSDVVTTGSQSYGSILLTKDVVLTAGGDALFNGDIQGSRALTVNSAGLTRFDGSVGLTSLVTDAAGSLIISGSISTRGSQTYGERLILAGDVSLSTNGAALTLSQGVDGAFGLGLLGDVQINGPVGVNSTLSSLYIRDDDFTLNTDITTTGRQIYEGAVTLAKDVVLTGTTVNITGAVEGAHALTINGSATFGGAVGTVAALTSLKVNGSTALNGGAITTRGAQVYGGAVTLRESTLGAGTLLTGGSVDLQGAVTSAGSLRVNSAGLTRFGGNVTVSSLTTDAAGSLHLNGGSITTTGAQTYGERVVLGADTVLTGTSITLSQGADGQVAGGQSLTIIGDNTAIAGGLGGNTALRSLSISGSGFVNGAMVTQGAQSYLGPVLLTGATSMTSTGGTLTFGSTVDATGGANLTLSALNGAITAQGAFGVSRRLGDLSVTGASVTFNGVVNAANLAVTGSGAALFQGALNLTGTNGLRVAGSNLTFNGAVTTAGAINLASNSTTGVISFAENANVQAGTGFTQTGGARVLLPATVAVTVGDITFAAPAELVAGTVSITAGGDITMPGLVGLNTNLTLSSDTGALLIGISGGSADQSLQVLTLTVPRATRATMYGSIGGIGGVRTAMRVNSQFVGEPYFINDTAWGPLDQVTQVVSSVVPRTAVPSTPTVTSLFTGTVSSNAVTPDALSAYQSPQVLTTSVGALGADGSPSVLTAPSNNSVSGNAAGSGAAGGNGSVVPSSTGGTTQPEEEPQPGN